MQADQTIQLCMNMHDKGYQYVCFDDRDLTPSTDVTAGLGVSETPNDAFIFTPTHTLQPRTCKPTRNIIFANPIDASLISYKDASLEQFEYKNDDADPNADPVIKYFWRGIASKLNASGVTVVADASPLQSLLVWRGTAVTDILNHGPLKF